MNPKEFSWTEDQRVTVKNPTNGNYRFKVHNKDYEVEAGTNAEMPGYIAWVYVYGLATQLAQEDKVFNRWNEEGFRNKYYDKLVVGSDDIVRTIEESASVVLGVPNSSGQPKARGKNGVTTAV